MKTRVVNIQNDKFDVYIGRQNRREHFGNPFVIGPDGSRKMVIDKFKRWLAGVGYKDREQKRRKFILSYLHTLKGKRLGCHCKPDACHGDILARMAESSRVQVR